MKTSPDFFVCKGWLLTDRIDDAGEGPEAEEWYFQPSLEESPVLWSKGFKTCTDAYKALLKGNK